MLEAALFATAAALVALERLVRFLSRRTVHDLRIADGDSCTVDGERLRLFGLDAPHRDAPGGREAVQAFRDLVDGARAIAIEPRGRCPYGRLLVVVWADGRDVGRELVRRGVARPSLRHSWRYLLDQRPARSRDRGHCTP